MKNVLKKIINSVLFYIGVIAMYIGPVLFMVLFFDFIYNFQIDLFEDGSSFLRIILAIWILIVHGAWIYVEFGEKIKKYL